jgi:hypothetical protein
MHFALSTWNAYKTVLMEAELELKSSPIPNTLALPPLLVSMFCFWFLSLFPNDEAQVVHHLSILLKPTPTIIFRSEGIRKATCEQTLTTFHYGGAGGGIRTLL